MWHYALHDLPPVWGAVRSRCGTEIVFNSYKHHATCVCAACEQSCLAHFGTAYQALELRINSWGKRTPACQHYLLVRRVPRQ